MSTNEKIEILQLINSIQNHRNQFVNITDEDIEKVITHIKKHDLNAQETIQLLKDLAYV